MINSLGQVSVSFHTWLAGETGRRRGVNWARVRFHLFVQIRREGRLALGRTLSRVTLGDSPQSAQSFIRFFIGMYIV